MNIQYPSQQYEYSLSFQQDTSCRLVREWRGVFPDPHRGKNIADTPFRFLFFRFAATSSLKLFLSSLRVTVTIMSLSVTLAPPSFSPFSQTRRRKQHSFRSFTLDPSKLTPTDLRYRLRLQASRRNSNFPPVSLYLCMYRCICVCLFRV